MVSLIILKKSSRLAKTFILILEGIIEKISYERSDNESVYEKSLSLSIPKNDLKKEFRH